MESHIIISKNFNLYEFPKFNLESILKYSICSSSYFICLYWKGI